MQVLVKSVLSLLVAANSAMVLTMQSQCLRSRDPANVIEPPIVDALLVLLNITVL